MKRRIVLLLLFVGSMTMMAQSESKTSVIKAERWMASGTCSFGFDDGGMHTRSFSMRSGYEVLPNFKPFLNLETQIGLYHKGMKKDYYNTANIGLGANYSIITQIEVHGLVGTSLGNLGWKYHVWEAGISIGFRHKSSQTIGFGYRYVHSKTDGIADYKGPFISIGYIL